MVTQQLGRRGDPRIRTRWPQILDWTAPLIAWVTALLMIGPVFTPKRSTWWEVVLTAMFVGAGWSISHFSGSYRGSTARERTSSMLRLTRTLTTTTLVVALAGVTFNLAVKELAVGFGLLWGLTLLGRVTGNSLIRVRRASGRDVDRVLIVGANNGAAEFCKNLSSCPELGLQPVAVVGNAAEAANNGLYNLYVGPVQAAADVADLYDIDLAVMMQGAVSPSSLSDSIDELDQPGVEVMLSSDLGQLHQHRLDPSPIAFSPIYHVDGRLSQARLLPLKRVLDLVFSSVALLLLAPVMIAAAIAIKATSRGPVFYRQRRLGIDGRSFDELRFRVMTNAVPYRFSEQPAKTVWGDARMTVVGRMLEILTVNELPQLLNVVKGDMSLVGPKPGYPNLDASVRSLGMRPGLTGLWRVESNLLPTDSAREVVDDLYVSNWSLTLDLGVLLSSLELVMMRLMRGAGWRHANRTAVVVPPPARDTAEVALVRLA